MESQVVVEPEDAAYPMDIDIVAPITVIDLAATVTETISVSVNKSSLIGGVQAATATAKVASSASEVLPNRPATVLVVDASKVSRSAATANASVLPMFSASSRKPGETIPRPLRFIVASSSSAAGTVTVQPRITVCQASLIASGQRAFLVGSPVTSPSNSPRKTVTVLPSSGLRPLQSRGTTGIRTVLSGRPSVPVVQTSGMNTRSSAALIVGGQTKTLNVGMGQLLALVSNSVTQSTDSTGSKMLSPYKVVIKPAPVSASATSVSQSVSVVQPVSVSGSKFQYVRLVGNSPAVQAAAKMSSVPGAIGSVTTVKPADTSKTLKTITATTDNASKQTTIIITSPTTAIARTSSQQRLILPAPSTSTVSLSRLQQSELTDAMSHMMKAAKDFNVGLRATSATSLGSVHSNHTAQSVSVPFGPRMTKYPKSIQPIVITPDTVVCVSKPATKQLEKTVQKQSVEAAVTETTRQSSNGNEMEDGKPMKPCNCTKSQCLKLYCDCFANGVFCYGCHCYNCANNLEHEDDRLRAIRACLERNPLAFHPKIGKGRDGDIVARQHSKGCNCKRSGCLKNYCECYEAKILCSSMCKCFGCKNYEDSQQRKTLMHLADAAEVRVQQQSAANSKLCIPLADRPSHRSIVDSAGKRPPYAFVTMDVIEASCSCLIATLEETYALNQPDMIGEQLVLEEFGRCLVKVIESANGSAVS